MVDQTLVQTGFDIEVLLSARYVTYALLAQIEAGLMPMAIEIVDPAQGVDVRVDLRPPTDYERRYEPDPAAVLPPAADGSFATEFVFGDPDGANLMLSVVTDILDRTTGDVRSGVTIGLMLAIGLEADVDDRGFESDHQLSISLVKLEPLTAILLALAGLDVDDVTARIKAQLDRSVTFGVASGQSVQAARLSVLDGGNGRPPAMGVYINLPLKDAPEADAFVGDRGNVDDAVNFLDDGKDVAFATSARLYDLLGDDIFHRMAEETPPDSGNFRHPLREIPGDPESEEQGTIHSVTVRAETDLFGDLTGRLLIDVSGEYQVDILPDPEFHLLITLRPVVGADGILDWDPDASVDVGIVGSLLSIVAIVAGTLILGPGVGMTLFLILLAADLIVDAVASAAAAARADDLADASFLDALPTRVTSAQRRWDPLYATRHQVAALLDRFDVTELGLAFDGVAVLDKEPAPITHAVIRDEARDGDGVVSGLHYRVRDLARILDDLTAVGPGMDRLPFAAVDAATDSRSEPNLVALTLAQVTERIEAGRLVAPMLCIPQRVHLEHNTIRQLLVLGQREIDEQRTAAIDAFRTAEDQRIRDEQGDDITQQETDALRNDLGREPTQEEIDDAVDAAVSALVDDAQVDYEATDLSDDSDALIAGVLRFDLVPAEFAELQGAGALAIAGKEIIRMASGTVYYRDRPDFFFRDNLLALRRYRFPYVPPAP